MDIKKQVGQLIKDARLQKGLTQKELGAKIGVGEPTINKYESGRQNLTLETLKKVSDALGVEIETLFRR